ncbi:MAG TPA: methionyl-tRNA formyltransferase, partial [Rhodospirillales bacterium]|nr:methionyl-tRNA formyltransferase [Rhodospirillales bacterium]
MSLRTIFLGSPEFAVTALATVIDAGHDIICVYSQPPRPAGRGQKEKLSAVHAFAGSSGLMVRTPTSLKETQTQADFLALEADVAVVAAYGLILPPAVLTAPRLGCLNIHASLLPRWRGAAPIQRAIMAGDAETGITIMAMDAGLDTGDILACERLPIGPETTATDLHDALAALGGRMIVEALANPEPG